MTTTKIVVGFFLMAPEAIRLYFTKKKKKVVPVLFFYYLYKKKYTFEVKGEKIHFLCFIHGTQQQFTAPAESSSRAEFRTVS